MKTVAIVQARMGSSRLPGKVMKPVVGLPMIEILLKRLSHAKLVDQIVVATSIERRDNVLADYVKNLGYECIQGDENDVLDRYLKTAEHSNADIIVRITGDCPLVDPEIVDKAIVEFKELSLDYYTNCSPVTFPDGMDVEVFSYAALRRSSELTGSAYDHEHVTPNLRESGMFKTGSFSHYEDLSAWRWTVDEPEDLDVIRNIFDYFSPDIYFSWRDLADLQRSMPDIFSANQNLKRNEGASMGNGQKLYRRAKKIIPGGTMLLSKRPEMFLPDQWPAYFSKSKGCTVWDLDNNSYVDMSIMGIGTNTLGYGHPEVDEAVLKIVRDGNMSTLNCPEEVYLAEKLVELHPWADMVRLARSGGEINSIAVRIARAATGRDKIAICGYHGWHDWYLSTNLKDDQSLDGHLLPGLEPLGVPKGLTGTTLPFNYNKIEELEQIVAGNPGQIAAIKMEVSRNSGPEDGFLDKVRKIANENNIVLIFDECTSGFRETYGGLYKKFGVEPDMAIFAKALGNGYAISACIGRRDIMQAAQKTFISSTFWTERIGPAAALKTLEVMEREKSWEKITYIGSGISKRWQELADKYELSIQCWGIPALSGFSFLSPHALEYKTLITQEMLKLGYLAGNSVYACTEHTQSVIDGYFFQLEPIFSLIKECEEGRDINSLLHGPVCHAGFKRLN